MEDGGPRSVGRHLVIMAQDWVKSPDTTFLALVCSTRMAMERQHCPLSRVSQVPLQSLASFI